MEPMVNIKPPPLIVYRPPPGPVEVIHEDAHVLIVVKPAGLLSVPGNVFADSLELRLRQQFPDALLLHRLDMDTSGIMVFARTKLAQRHLGWQFERRTLRKRYVARVAGQVRGQAGVIALPIMPDWPNRPCQKVDRAHGKPSVTHWQVRARGADDTLLSLTPKTGRTHQLRVHCRAMGHPILGDRFYAGPKAPRLMLHAEALDFRHPDGGAWHSYTVPVDF